MKTVVFAPEVVDELFELISVLVKEEYLSTFDLAEAYAQDVISYTEQNIDIYPAKIAPLVFSRYGTNLKYLHYKRNQRTTWYILFETHENAYLVTHITNNHVSAQYFEHV